MGKFLIPFSIVILLLSANFGLAAMNHMSWQGHVVCPFQTAGDCALVQSSLGFATSHLSAFSRFFTAIPVNSSVVFVALFLLLAFSLSDFLRKQIRLPENRLAFAKTRLGESFIPPNKTIFIKWLALSENSPAFSQRR